MKVKDAAMQAFPFIEPAADDAVKAYHPGMTMRDQFAAKAMSGLIGLWTENSRHLKAGQTLADLVAEQAYVYADAMMEARKC